MKLAKKIAVMVIAASMMVSALVGCGSQSATTTAAATEAATTAAATEAATTEAATEAATTEAATEAETTAAQADLGIDGKLIMATNAAFPPYEYKDGDDYAGIDVEVAGEIAKKLGLELEIDDIDFGAIIAGVQTGKYSMGMAGMTVTDERKQSVNFSDTYAVGIQSVIVKSDSSIKSLDDISSSNKIGVQQDTTGDIYASDDYGQNAVVRYKTGADAVQALVTGKVDCVIIDNEPAKSYVAANEGLTILDTAYAEEEYAICIAKENTALLDAINTALAELKADGTLDAIVAKYIPAE